MQYKILVVDDDDDIRKAIRIYLEQESYQVIEAIDGKEALEKVKYVEFHLIILDVMMPNLDGILTTYHLRQGHNIPILMLSAKIEEVDKIHGLQVGADDYLTKPFSPLELLARVKSLLRRYMDLGEYKKKDQLIDELVNDGLVLNKLTKTVKVEEQDVRMTPKEFQILQLLMENPGRVFSISEIYELVWKEPSFNPENTVAVHIRKIREKIEVNPKEPKYIKVVWGVGYKMEK